MKLETEKYELQNLDESELAEINGGRSLWYEVGYGLGRWIAIMGDSIQSTGSSRFSISSH
jgi:hypothetical protein